jgi:catechol 2,3-dioxygenase-like lactoylglutathione lyase family enzyme
MSKFIQRVVIVSIIGLVCQPDASFAQLSEPNAAGVAMGHIHYNVRDIAANEKFWVALGGTPMPFGSGVAIRFPDVIVLLREAESTGGSEGSVVNHVAFRVKSLADLEAAGFDVHYNEEYPGVASVFTPENERIELFDDELATNLGFTVEAGSIDDVANRHNRKLTVPIIAHHIHLNVPEDQVIPARDWYARNFGGAAGKRWRYDATDFPGINLNFSTAPEATVPTRGRRLDHIGFEVRNLEAFCAELEANGIVFDQAYRRLPSGLGLAFLTDPWGTYIELTEGLRDL